MFTTCKHVLPHMRRRGKGAIVNIASISGIRWHGGSYISYASTKAAVIQFTRVIALQYARSGIRANSILPGMKYADGPRPGVIAAYGGSAEEPARRVVQLVRDDLLGAAFRRPPGLGGANLTVSMHLREVAVSSLDSG